MIGDAAALVATVLAVAMLAPQIVRLIRTGYTEGVAPTWAALGVVINSWWVAYVIAEELWLALPVTAIVVVSYAITLYLLLELLPWARARSLAAALAITALAALVLTIGGWTVLGVTLGLAYGVQVTPSVVAAYRTEDPRGVSIATWVIAGIEAVLWGIYAISERDAGIMVYGAIGTVLTTAIVLRVWHTRRRSPEMLVTSS